MRKCYTHTIKRIITININGDEEHVQKLTDYLTESFKDCEVDKEEGRDYSFSIEISETGTEKCWPGCYTLPNGDPGYPDEYEDDLEIFDSIVADEVEKFTSIHPDMEFDYTITQEDESADYLDY